MKREHRSRWEADGIRGSRKEITKKVIVAIGIQEGVSLSSIK